ncbi:MAG: OmpA family protein [Myxococcota bacterium]
MRSLRFILSFLTLFVSPLVQAQDTTNTAIDVQLFHPTPGARNFFTTESGEVNSHLGISTGIHINYARNPLSIQSLQVDGSKRDVGTVIKNRTDVNILAALGLFNHLELGFALPLITQGGLDSAAFNDANVNVGIQSLTGFTLGDLRVVPKLSYSYNEGLFAVAVVPTVVIPVGGAEYAGEDDIVIEPSLALSTHVGIVRGAINVGYRQRKQARIQTLVIDDEIFAKAAVAVDILMGRSDTPFEIVAEVFGSTPAESFDFGVDSGLQSEFDKARTPLEFDVGVRFTLMDSLLFTVGGGGGILPGYGAPAPRVFAGLSYVTGNKPPPDMDNDKIPDEKDQCPDKPEDIDGFEDEDGCPDFDNDGDNILDEDDQCPLEMEDRDGFEDEDGCPEVDNDQDGLLDADDPCPLEAEDKDGFQDEDGCPDLDNDGDTIADAVDKCPNEPEDKDGFEDSDGCPDNDNDKDGLPDLNDLCPNHPEDMDGVADDDGCPEDNDGDGIADEIDKCPNEAENYNGIDDEDGCPEKLKVKSLVSVTQEKIEIKEKVFFRSGRATILSKSYNLLNQVASVLKNYKHITKVRIEGHTDSRGGKRSNMRLSKLRAEAVRTYLIAQGIAEARLEAEGFGPSKPIASNRTNRGREQNRRVEFVIAEQKPIGVDVSEGQVKEPEIELELEIPGAPKAPPPVKPDEGKKGKPGKGKKDEAEIEFNF